MTSHANLPTGYSFCCLPGDIMSYPFYDLYSYEPNKGELVSKILVYEFEHLTKKGRTCMLWFLFLSWVSWDQRWSETLQFVTNQMNIRGLHSPEGHCYLQYSQLYSASFKITNWIDNLITTIFSLHTMSMNGSPPKTTNMAPPGGLFGSQQCPDDNVGASDNNAGNTPNKDTQFRQPTIQFPPPPGYSYSSSQPPLPGFPQFYHHVPFNMTPSSQPSSGATKGYASYGPPWQGYDLPQGSYGGPQMFPPQQFTGQGPSSPSAPRVPPALPGNIPVIRPTSSASTPYWQLPGASGRPPISLPMKWFQPPAGLHRTDVAGIADLPPLPEISYDEFNADFGSDEASDLGGAEGKAPISLKPMEFSLKQFAKRMGQLNFSAFNKWKKVCVAGFLEKKHRFIIPGQSRLEKQHDGPLHWETVVADFLETFEKWLPLENFDNAKWIWWQWVVIFLKKCASEVREARKKGRWGNKRLLTDLGERAGKKVRGNVTELPNTTFMVVICSVPNGNNDLTFSMQLQASYTDVRHWEELIDFIEKNSGPKEPYCVTVIYKFNLTQEELDQEYMGLYALGQMMNVPLNGQISYNSSLSNAFKLKLEHDVQLFLVEMKAATG